LVWSGLSETFDPRNVEQAIRSYTRAMVKALRQTDLLRPTASRDDRADQAARG
jgi:hypothetical protein